MTRPRATTSQADQLGATIADLKARLSSVELLAHTPCSTGGQVPVGTVVPFAGSTAPASWLLCAGQAVSRVTYSGLFVAVGTTYGVGDGSTTFNLPDLRGRVIAGLDDMNGTAAGRLTNTVLTASNTLGASGGTQTHTLTTTEMPSHTHTMPVDSGAGGAASRVPPSNGTFSGFNTVASNATGGGGAHLNTQPTLVLNYIIRAG